MSIAEAVSPPAGLAADRIVDFDIYHPPGVKDGFHEAWKVLHREGIPEVVWTPHNGGHWIATRAKAINKVLADYRRFSSHTIFVPKETVGAAYRGALPGTVDPPEHKPYRQLLNERLSPQIVAAMEPDVRHHAAELAEALRPHGACNFVTDFSEILPIQVLMTLMQLPMEDVPMLRSWANLMVRPTGNLDFAEGKQKYLGYLAPVVDARKGAGGNDLLSHLINTPIGDRTLTRDEALNFCFLVLFGGLDTVVQFLSFAMQFLARNPQRRRELVADPTLVSKAIEELLRRFPVVNIAREVTEDIEFEGAHLRKGDMIIAALPLAGIDDTSHDCPMSIDFSRKRVEHATFGGGAHRCPGHHLARLEIRVMLEEWLSRIPEFQVAPGAQVQFTSGITGSVDTLPLVWDPAAITSHPLA